MYNELLIFVYVEKTSSFEKRNKITSNKYCERYFERITIGTIDQLNKMNRFEREDEFGITKNI